MSQGRKSPFESNRSLVAIIVICVMVTALILGGVALMLPDLISSLNEGLTIKDAGKIALGVGFAAILVMAVVSGDGLLGELPIMVAGFFLFFIFFTISLSWLF